MSKREMPEFSSPDEMARFFDENSVVDLDLQVEDVKDEEAKGKSRT